jgi:hypothetical protein
VENRIFAVSDKQLANAKACRWSLFEQGGESEQVGENRAACGQLALMQEVVPTVVA